MCEGNLQIPGWLGSIGNAIFMLGNPMAPSPELFISHSHADEALAARLLRLIKEGLEVPSGAIRCSSVPGYKLELGALVNSTLQQELETALRVVALITPNSVKSPWVLYELGALWGLDRTPVPLLAGGVDADDLPGPLENVAAGRIEDPADVAQLIETLHSDMGWPRRHPARAVTEINALASYAAQLDFTPEEMSQLRVVRNMPTAMRELLEAGLHRLDVASYTGNLTKDALRAVEPRLLDGLELRMLIRDPLSHWRHPTGPREQYRKGQVEGVKEELATHDRYQSMAHRASGRRVGDYVRHWQGDPMMRAVLGELRSGSHRLCLGFYPLRERRDPDDPRQRLLDFSGTDRPVIVTEDKGLVADFSNWFEFMWNLAGV